MNENQPPISDPTQLPDTRLGEDPGEAVSPEGAAGTPPPSTHAGPVRIGDRIDAIDVLRGLAVLGILVINITHFALPERSNMIPALSGGFSGADFGFWAVSKLFFELKMMTLFSILFGAGLWLQAGRLTEQGWKPARIVLPRLAWLWVFGMLHAYLLWEGDILVAYAVCGAMVYPLRRIRPTRKIIVAALVFPVAALLFTGFGLLSGAAREAARNAETVIAEGGTPDPGQETLLEIWEELRSEVEGDPEKQAREVEAKTGSYGSLFTYRAAQAFAMQTFVFLLFAMWRIVALMLLGMALLEWGILRAACTDRFYAMLCLIGYPLGLGLEAFGMRESMAREFDPVYLFTAGIQVTYFASMFVAMGHLGLIMLLVKRFGTFGILGRLAAAGRMAFSNYIGQTLIATTLFYGWGFGLWDELSRSELAVVVLSIWIFQLMISPWWLDRFRMGPLEWLWRSLTYRERPPFRRRLPDPSIEA